MLDLAAVPPPRPLEKAYEQGWILGLLEIRALDDVLARASGHGGARALRALVNRAHGGRTITRSTLEELFLSLVDRAGIPRPELNVDIPVPGEEINVDCLWRAERLVVELDSRRYHRDNPGAFTGDRRRDRLLRLAGYDSARFTDEELERAGDDVVATVVALRAKLARGTRKKAVRCPPEENVGAVLARSTIGLRSSPNDRAALLPRQLPSSVRCIPRSTASMT